MYYEVKTCILQHFVIQNSDFNKTFQKQIENKLHGSNILHCNIYTTKHTLYYIVECIVICWNTQYYLNINK